MTVLPKIIASQRMPIRIRADKLDLIVKRNAWSVGGTG